MMRLLSKCLALCFVAATTNATLQIVPGGTWTAVYRHAADIAGKLLSFNQTNTGKHIQAHGGGILKVGDIYYWYTNLSATVLIT